MDETKGFCKCKGKCGGKDAPTINRRNFLKGAAAAGTLGALHAIPARTTEEDMEALKRWTQSLHDKGARRIYRGETLREIAFPLGGIGAGQIFLTGRGRLERWQIFNNFNSNANAPGAYFGLWAKTAGQTPIARLLQEEAVDGIPACASLAFSGEYPFAWIDYADDKNPLPLAVRLEAFSPMIPLNAEDSGLPSAIFRFTLTNPSDAPVEAALLATMPNLVGWDGYAALSSNEYEEYCGNINEIKRHPGAAHIHMRTQPGNKHQISRPCHLVVNDDTAAWSMRDCVNLTIRHDRHFPRGEYPGNAIFWMGSFPNSAPGAHCSEALEKVRNGAALIISGLESNVLDYSLGDEKKQRRDDVVFENWESGNYAKWTVEGDAFGTAPATGTLPGQQPVHGFRGKYLVNTFHEGDSTTGRAVSRGFQIKHDYIHLMVGGGNHPGETCVNLVINEDVVHSAAGRNTEELQFVTWDCRKLRGQRAQLEIMDTHTGGWGHVLVGDIIFSNVPLPPGADSKVAAQIQEAMPFTWREHRIVVQDPQAAVFDTLPEGISPALLAIRRYRAFTKAKMRPGAQLLLAAKDGTPLIAAGNFGKGRIVFINGDLREWTDTAHRTEVIGAILAYAAGVNYSPRTGWTPDAPQYGDMVFSVLSPDADLCAAWEDFPALWADFSEDGRLQESPPLPPAPGRSHNAAISIPVQLAPGASKEVCFVLSWHFPNRVRTAHYGWGPGPLQYDHRLGNHYNNRFKSAMDVAEYVRYNRDRLETETRLFQETFYDSTLPHWFLDCITANASIVRSPIYVWLEDGSVAGFEGSDACCPMNCTHVYNYAMVMPYLFPALERRVREMDILRQMHPDDHFIPHRTVLPVSLPRLGDAIGGPHHHALDGELGTLLKAFREWRMCGDREWLEQLWPNMKKVMTHILRDHDIDGSGVLKGEQPNTYDTHLYGSNTFIGSLYLATLRAFAEMAQFMGDQEIAAQCRQRYESGREGYVNTCWNGEYFVNVYDAPGAGPDTYEQDNCYGPGCHSDQLLGQWWAHMLGLGRLFPKEHIRGALQAIHKHSWRADFHGHTQQPRRFAFDDEKGLLNCSWPKGGRPRRPILYCDEIWTGIEYQVAATMLYEGMPQEAFQIVKGARDRYTGNQRNPWSEIECGGHYARAMAAWSLLHAAAGYEFDAAAAALRFAPNLTPDAFRCFFTAPSAWGALAMRKEPRGFCAEIDVRWGALTLKHVILETPFVSAGTSCAVSGNPHFRVEHDGNEMRVSFQEPVGITPGNPLVIQCRT